MADYNIFVYIFPSNKTWCEKCGTFFLYLLRSKSLLVRNISLEKWTVESALKGKKFWREDILGDTLIRQFRRNFFI